MGKQTSSMRRRESIYQDYNLSRAMPRHSVPAPSPRIHSDGAMKYLTNLKNHSTVSLEGFMIRAVFAAHPGISGRGIWAIINGITNDRRHEGQIEFVDKKK
jgi:hypothetical protein